jgi:tetratricopeptide (TPR) repeat protein
MKADLNYGLSVLFYLGFIYYYLNNFEMSREYFDRILKESSSKQRDASAYFGIAFNEFHDKNYLNVISLCEKIINLDENFFDKESLGFLTAASYFYLGRKDIFRRYYSQLIKTYPEGRYKKELEKLDRTDSPGQSS